MGAGEWEGWRMEEEGEVSQKRSQRNEESDGV